jgi:hypothetical protein
VVQIVQVPRLLRAHGRVPAPRSGPGPTTLN